MPDTRHHALDHWLAGHAGVVSQPALLSMGFSSSAAHRLLGGERFEQLVRGIYRSLAFPQGREQLMVAACLHVPDGAIGFTTAGQMLGYRRMSDPRVHFLVPHGSSPRIPGVVVHRCRKIDPVDLAGRRTDGIRLTSPPRTLHDAASIIGADGTESAIEQALAERWCTIETLMATSRRLYHCNRPGSAIFERVIASRPAWRGIARSDLERTVRTAIAAAGLPAPEVNLKMVLPNGDPIEIDLAWPAWLVAVEVDHPFWHDVSAAIARDKRRDRKLQALGWTTPRLTQHDVDHALTDAIGDLSDILVLRGWRPNRAA